MTKIISNLQLKSKRIPSNDLWSKLKGTNNFYWIEIVLIWLILLNPRFETQVTLITSYFLKKFTNYFIIAWYFCQKVLHNSFIYEAFWDIKVSFLHWAVHSVHRGSFSKYLFKKWRRIVENAKLSQWHHWTRIHCPQNQLCSVFGVIHKWSFIKAVKMVKNVTVWFGMVWYHHTWVFSWYVTALSLLFS